jgi:uncharacterized lipoprotein NlpE involved in copper resistance
MVKQIISVVAVFALTGFALTASAQNSRQQDPAQQQQQVDAQSQQSARAFEGKIAKAGDKLVLQESSTQTAYQLDDQSKAKQFEGKNVKVMATMDSSTNTLHIVDITPSESR